MKEVHFQGTYYIHQEVVFIKIMTIRKWHEDLVWLCKVIVVIFDIDSMAFLVCVQ